MQITRLVPLVKGLNRSTHRFGSRGTKDRVNVPSSTLPSQPLPAVHLCGNRLLQWELDIRVGDSCRLTHSASVQSWSHWVWQTVFMPVRQIGPPTRNSIPLHGSIACSSVHVGVPVELVLCHFEMQMFLDWLLHSCRTDGPRGSMETGRDARAPVRGLSSSARAISPRERCGAWSPTDPA